MSTYKAYNKIMFNKKYKLLIWPWMMDIVNNIPVRTNRMLQSISHKSPVILNCTQK